MKHSLALQQALFAHLQADAGLSAALGGPKIYDAPPHAQTGAADPPYVTLGDETVTAWNSKTESGAAHELRFTVWSRARGFSEIKSAMSALYDALDGVSITFSGGHIVDLRFVSSETRRERRVQMRRADCVFRALVETVPSA